MTATDRTFFRYLGKRLLLSLLSAFVIATIVFVLVQALPGERFIAFNRTDPAIIASLLAKYGLDESLLQQYLKFLGRLLHFDMGISSSYAGQSVNTIIAATFPISFRIATLSTALGGILGVTLAGVSVMSKKRWAAWLCRTLILLGISASVVIFAPVFQLTFGVRLRWLPVGLLLSPKYYILPVASLACTTAATVGYIASASMREAHGSDYFFVAKQKGFSNAHLFFHCILRNSAVPVVSQLAMCLAGNTVGSFFLESIYTIPGIGSVMVNAVNNLDYGLIMGLTVFFGMLFISIILVMDLLCSLIDPRIRLTR